MGEESLEFILDPIKFNTVSPPLRCFFGAVLPWSYAAEMDPAASYTLLRSSASIIKLFASHVFHHYVIQG